MALEAAMKFICKERQDSFRMEPDGRQAREETRWPEEEASTFLGPPSRDLLQMLRAATSPTGSLKAPSPTGSLKAPGGSPIAAPVLQARPVVESSVHSCRSPRGADSCRSPRGADSTRSPRGVPGRPPHKAPGRGGARQGAGRTKSREPRDEVYGDENRRINPNVDKDLHRACGRSQDKVSAQCSPRQASRTDMHRGVHQIPDSPLKRSNTDKVVSHSHVKESPLRRSNTDKGIAQAYPSVRSQQSPRPGYGSLQSPPRPSPTHGPPRGAVRVTATPSLSWRSDGRAAPQKEAVSGAVHNSRQSKAAPLEPAPSFSSSVASDWPEHWAKNDAFVVYQPRGNLPENWPATPQVSGGSIMSHTPQPLQSSFHSNAPSNGSFHNGAGSHATSPSLSEFAKDAEMIRQKVVAELTKVPSFDSSVCHELHNTKGEMQGLSHPGVGVLESLRDYVPPPVSSPAMLKAQPARGLAGHRPIQRRTRSCSIFWRPPPEAVAVCESVRSPSFLLHISGSGAARENTTESAVIDGDDDNSCQPKAALNVCGSLLSPTFAKRANRSAMPPSFSYAPPPGRGYAV